MSDSPGRQLFVVFDTIAQTFVSGVVMERHQAPVVRAFGQALVDPQQQFHKNPKDYQLLHVGFIADDGQITPCLPVIVVTGEAMLANLQTQQG